VESRHKIQYAFKRRWLYSHYWTLFPHLSGRFIKEPSGPRRDWTTGFKDPVMGESFASGVLHETPGAETLVVIIHGLGSGPGVSYVLRAAHHFIKTGHAVLRLSHRGADALAPDYYNSALTRDLHAAMDAEDLAQYSKRYVLGYSLGGHLAMRFATETSHPKVWAAAAVCPPLDLAGCQTALDAPKLNVYRRHCLAGLRRTVRAAEARARSVGRTLPTMGVDLSKIQTIKDWDEAVVVPRFGYRDADDYYASASVGPRLKDLRRPALVVAATYDPMVPIETLRPHLSAGPVVSVITDKGGHVGFPSDLDLGFGPKLGLVEQIDAWFQIQSAPSRSEPSGPDINMSGYGQYVQRE